MNQAKPKSLFDMLRLSYASFGAAPALFRVLGVELQQAYSYASLYASVRAFGARLGQLGVAKGDRVLLLAENSPEWAVAYFGIFSAGAVAVPVLTDFIPEHVATVAEHAQVKVACVSERTRAKLTGYAAGIPTIDLDNLLVTSPAAPVSLPPVSLSEPCPGDELDLNDLACVLYTSGTSGKSKGVMLSHGNLVSNTISMCDIFPVYPSDRFLSLMPLAHTLEGTAGFLVPLRSGSSIYYTDKAPTPSLLALALKAVRPHLIMTVPLIIEKMYRAKVEPALKAHPLYRFAPTRALAIKAAGRKLYAAFGGELRFFGIAGAALAPDVEEFLQKARFPFAIGYGLTETSPLVTAAIPFQTVPRAAGLPIQGVQIRLGPIDGSSGVIPAGSGQGEVQVKGPNVMQGYYLDPERTAEAFTQDGWFRTGDLGSIDKDGRLFIRGRSKAMILGASGENIYPEEIESVLNATGLVEESLVYAAKDGGLVALVVLNDAAKALLAGAKDAASAAGAAGVAAGEAAARLVKAATEGASHAASDAGAQAEKLVAELRSRANARLAAFSRLARVVLHDEPFEKTATRKIKRFLYPRQGSQA